MGTDWLQKLTYGVDYTRTKVKTLQTGLTPAAGETFPLKRFPDTTEASAAVYIQNEIVGEHWIHNDSTPRYDEAAAKLAWDRTIAWFRRYLA